MEKIRHELLVLSMLLLCMATPASAQVSIGIWTPNVSIGINLPLYPELVRVPGYPVYYAPRLNGNYFFYDGLYWVFQNDNWYASSWYNGPWGRVEAEYVPLYILRIPVRYYRRPPHYFRGWRSNAPPRWGEHWGRRWEEHHKGWDRWNRRSAPDPAPLPTYQRDYSGDRYPRQLDQQQTLHDRHYRYQPRDTIVRKHFRQQREQRAPEPARREKQGNPPARNQKQPDKRSPTPNRQDTQSPQHRTPEMQHQRQQPGKGQPEHPDPKVEGKKQGSQKHIQDKHQENKKEEDRDQEGGY